MRGPPRLQRRLAAALALAAPVLVSTVALAGLPAGAPCAAAAACASGFCADGVCCDSACNAAPCTACSKAAGAAADGTCATLDGAPCDDHDPCTQTDACHGGACVGANPVVCPADACHDAYCDPTSPAGACLTRSKADGAPCDDGDVCTQTDTCQGGACVGASPVVCPLQADCQTEGVCDPVTGCSTKAAPTCGVVPEAGPGLLLADGGLCSAASACASGFCVAGVCCDSACQERCRSCALPASPGTCTLEPAGVDLGHDCAPEGTCLGTCGPDGACIGSGPETQCAPARCIDDHRGLGPALCPSAGAACPTSASVPFDCAPYLCQAALGACAPPSCASVHDCAAGFACGADHRCTRPPDVAGGDDGGCRVGTGDESSAAAWWALGVIAAFAMRRRGGRR